MPKFADEPLNLVPFHRGLLEKAAIAYQRVWGEESAYAEVFTHDKACEQILGMRDLWVAVDNDIVMGLVGGVPLTEYIDRVNLAADRHVRKALDALAGRETCFYLDTLAVTKEFQGKGRGTRLLEFVVHDRSLHQFTAVLLRTTLHPDNPAVELYRDLEFRPFLDDRGMPVVQIETHSRLDERCEQDCRAYLLKTPLQDGTGPVKDGTEESGLRRDTVDGRPAHGG